MPGAFNAKHCFEFHIGSSNLAGPKKENYVGLFVYFLIITDLSEAVFFLSIVPPLPKIFNVDIEALRLTNVIGNVLLKLFVLQTYRLGLDSCFGSTGPDYSC